MARIVVIGGTGLIGSRVVAHLTAQGHQAIAASPSTGVDTVTGDGLADVLRGAQTVVDVTNSPSFEAEEVLRFFTISTENIVSTAKAAGVNHFVALTIVGTDRPNDIAYFRAKSAQEALIRDSGIPFSLIHATQFFEFIGAIADGSTVDSVVRLPGALIQPIAADDVAAVVAEVAAGAPLDAGIEIAGPQALPMDELVRRTFALRGDSRAVVRDDSAGYYGALIEDRTLVPVDGARISDTNLEAWIAVHPTR